MDGETAITTIAAQMAAERGVVVVVSAGNQGFDSEHNTLGAPADGELVLTIGAVDSFGARADFSSVGRTADGRIKPDVMAGVAALVLQAHPDWTVDRVRRAMRSTAHRTARPNRLLGWGILDALKAAFRR